MMKLIDHAWAYVGRTFATLKDYPVTILLIFATFTGAMLLSAAAYTNWGIQPAELFKDANAVTKSPHYYGLFSQLGVIIWAMAAGSLILTLATGRLTGSDRRYVGYSLVFTLLLLFDDTYQLHENYSPHFKSIEYTHLLYAGMIGAYFLFFRTQLLESPLILLALALFFFIGSLAFDSVPDRGALVPEIMIYYVEDGLKLLGLCFWSTFYVIDCRNLLERNRSAQRSAARGGNPLTDRQPAPRAGMTGD